MGLSLGIASPLMAGVLISSTSIGPDGPWYSNPESTICFLVRGSQLLLHYALYLRVKCWAASVFSFTTPPSFHSTSPTPPPLHTHSRNLSINIRAAHLPTGSQGQGSQAGEQPTARSQSHPGHLKHPSAGGAFPLSAWTIAKKSCPAVSLILYSYFHLFFISQDVNESVWLGNHVPWTWL